MTASTTPTTPTAPTARMYQRRHARSPQALAKPYTFLDTGVRVDVEPLLAELADVELPYLESLWKWHRGTRFTILRAGPQGALPGDELITGHGVDAPILERLPRLRALLDGALGFTAPLAWLGLSPPNSAIRMHVDNTAHWDEHHRLHLPLITSPGARLSVMGRFQHFPAGTLFAFNNSRPHGAINEGPARLHLVFDVPAGPEIDGLLAASTPLRGELDAPALARLSEDPLSDLTPEERADPVRMIRYLNQ
ncbi:MAG: aspartyl/asparaginyl beta-hydroxylase domain-containing protein [Myxococcales bacterium]|nr:aspartyl/asparaginyl beta-hydroxylase domain-containing protein [Myxococcales bacterium]